MKIFSKIESERERLIHSVSYMFPLLFPSHPIESMRCLAEASKLTHQAI